MGCEISANWLCITSIIWITLNYVWTKPKTTSLLFLYSVARCEISHVEYDVKKLLNYHSSIGCNLDVYFLSALLCGLIMGCFNVKYIDLVQSRWKEVLGSQHRPTRLSSPKIVASSAQGGRSWCHWMHIKLQFRCAAVQYSTPAFVSRDEIWVSWCYDCLCWHILDQIRHHKQCHKIWWVIPKV